METSTVAYSLELVSSLKSIFQNQIKGAALESEQYRLASEISTYIENLTDEILAYSHKMRCEKGFTQG